jgi:hypothetical protein
MHLLDFHLKFIQRLFECRQLRQQRSKMIDPRLIHATSRRDPRKVRNTSRTDFGARYLHLMKLFLGNAEEDDSCTGFDNSHLEGFGSVKGADARSQTRKEFARLSGGALDTAPALREFPRRGSIWT